MRACGFKVPGLQTGNDAQTGDRAGWGAILIAIAAVSLMSCLRAQRDNVRQVGEEDLLPNPHLVKGPETARPFGWQSFGTSNANRVSVVKAQDGSPEVEVTNAVPGASGLRLMAPFVEEGWYKFSAEIRADGVGEDGSGAQLRIAMGDGVVLPTPKLHGTTTWKKIEVYYLPGRREYAAMIACQLGTKNGPSTGGAYCRNLRMVSIPAAPPPTAAQFSGDTLELSFAIAKLPQSSGTKLGLVFLLFSCGIVATLGWRLLA